jgi:hypothetical protein
MSHVTDIVEAEILARQNKIDIYEAQLVVGREEMARIKTIMQKTRVEREDLKRGLLKLKKGEDK